MKARNIAIIPLLLIASISITGCTSVTAVTGDKLVKQESSNLVVQSNVQMTDTNINSQIPGKVKEVKVKEGDSVQKGQVLIVMDSDSIGAQKAQVEAQIETVTAQINAAKAAREAASAKLEQAQNGARPEEIDQAKAAYDLSKAAYDRTKTLYDIGSSAKSELDNVEMQLELSKDKYDIAQKGARPEEIKAAQAAVNQANASVEAAEGQLKQAQAGLDGVNVNINNATVVAPADGVVTQVNIDPGELVSTGMPLAVITNTNDVSILCNVKETDLSKVDMNQEVTIKIPAYKDETFKGKVVKINKNADFAVKRATNDNGEFDILSYGVKVEIENLDKPLRAGMTVFVDFGK